MKMKLRDQITEFDCGTTSILNAFSYLYEREEIPAELLKAVFAYTLDCFDTNGVVGQLGTSIEAVAMISHWINDYTERKNFDLKCIHYTIELVTKEIIEECIRNNGCVLLRTYLEEDHYLLITDIDNEYVYMYDPYYLDDSYKDESVELINNEPFKYNRKIAMNRFMLDVKKDFALGPVSKRECLTLNRINNSNNMKK